MRWGCRFPLLLAAMTALAPLAAQTTKALAGSVWDASGAAAPECELEIVAEATGAKREARSDGEGRYAVPGLVPGTYRIAVSRPGFRSANREGIEVPAGQTVRADFTLDIGEVRESVVVTAEPPLVSSSASDWGGSIEQQKLDTLPLKGRDMFDLVAQYPAATVPANVSRNIFTGPATPVSVNGARPWQNSFRLDGIYINEASGAAPATSTGRPTGHRSCRKYT
ncbi:MAG: carboxypeptidase regulatory-like domain-containing protein [Bryobacteraceae bacterium]|nr:carboxypeptidase regulatory-like domain-containing protein [Bryobacteraceae bacterium]